VIKKDQGREEVAETIKINPSLLWNTTEISSEELTSNKQEGVDSIQLSF
jgi:hypothetical protein